MAEITECNLIYRNVSVVRGFSRETLVALVANIESRDWRRIFNIKNNIPAEHPRASTTDDVECFLACCGTMLERISCCKK